MLVKTGDAEILDVVKPEEVEDDNKRKDVLATALDRAKKQIAAKKADDSTETTEDSES